MTQDLETPIEGGLIAIADKPTDFQLGAELELPTPRMTYWDKQIQTHQPDVHANSCTVHGAFGCVSDLTGYEFTLEQRKEMWNEALARGADPSVGWYMQKAVDLVRQFASRYTGIELMTFRVELLSEDFLKAIEKGYTVNVGYSGNSAYNDDRKDGHLEGTSFGARTYGHAVRMTKSKTEPGKINVVVDNYSKRTSKPNTYTVPAENIRELVLNRCFFSLGYVFVVKADFESMNDPVIPLWATSSAEKAKKAGIITDWSDPLAPVVLNEDAQKSRFEHIIAKVGGLRAFFNQLGLAKEAGDSMNISELAVVLDRGGFLD